MIFAVVCALREAADCSGFVSLILELPSSRLRILGSPTCGTRVTAPTGISFLGEACGARWGSESSTVGDGKKREGGTQLRAYWGGGGARCMES